MEELTEEQKRMFNRFIKVFATEESLQGLERLLTSFENQEIKNTLNEIKEIREKIQGNKESEKMSIQEAIDDIYKSQRDIDEIYWKIFDLEEGDKNKSSVLNEIESIKQFAVKMRESYYRFYDTKDSEGNVTHGLISKLDEACKRIEENKDKLDKIERYYIELFDGIQADENGEGEKPSLEKFIKDKQDEMKDLLSERKKAFDASLTKQNEEYQASLSSFKDKSQKLIEEKESLIDSFLPGATSAGLASAYQNEKNNIQKELKNWQIIFWGSVIVFLICFGVYFWKTFDENFTYISLFRSLPLWIFSGFFTFFATKQISEYKRLASEYAHKGTLNATYMGYEKAIQKIDNQELKEKLLKTMIQTADFNPSTTLSKTHGEHISTTVMNKVSNFSKE